MQCQAVQSVDEHIFRAYDIRGQVDTVLGPDVVYSVGLAFAAEALQCQQGSVVVAHVNGSTDRRSAYRGCECD
jgi:phosphomannomutase